MGGRYPKLPPINCKYCGKEFKRQTPTQIYCCVSCKQKGIQKRKKLKCLVCGKPFEVREFWADKRKHCSFECRNIALSANRQKENNPQWKGGKGAYKTIAFREATHIKCDICGRDDVLLDVHHKDFDPKHKNNESDNLQILCKKCHYRVHYEHREQNNLGGGLNSRTMVSLP